MVEKKKNKSKNNNSGTSKFTEDEGTSSKEEKHGKLTEAAINIEAGIEVAGEKISVLSEKAAETAGEIYRVAKDKISSTYDSGAKIVEDISHIAQNYIDKYKQNLEIKRLTDDREQLTQKLGTEFFSQIKSQKGENPNLLLNYKNIQDLIAEIGTLDKNIIKIGNRLEKSKN